MATYIAAIVETGGREDFWDIARRHNVEPLAGANVPTRALITCGTTSDFESSLRLAEALARELDTTSVGFYAQTSSDCYEVRAFERGQNTRRLAYARDQGGWLHVEGTTQAWEACLFFDDKASTDASSDRWPDTIYDELSDETIARYEAAKAAGDPASVMDFLHPSIGAIRRMCAFFGVDADTPTAHLRKPSLWSRWFARST
ncbi:MAG: hypothetical protein HOW73_04995 [Polyangiaceae bacterium]|nr:hypothetical protein [Polyangiaceae bacterium]